MTKKGGKKGAKGGGGKHKKQNDQKHEEKELLPNRVKAVRPMWESLPQHERVKLLTLDLQLLRDRARHTTEFTKQLLEDHGKEHGAEYLVLEPSLEEVLHEGVKRLRERGTWKLWRWPTQPLPNVEQREFTEAEAFRQHLVENHISRDLVRFLPREDPKAPERPAEKAFRERMLDLLARVQQLSLRQTEEQFMFNNKQVKEYRELGMQLMEPVGPTIVDQRPIEQQSVYRRRRHHAADAYTALHDSTIEMVNLILEALEKEHEVLYSTVVNPIIAYIMEVLPEEQRKTHRGELAFEDFDKLIPDDVAHILEWLTEKVDALSTKLKDEEGMEEGEEKMGDVDLWALTCKGDALTVNPKWLQHLQERLLGEVGYPRKAKPSEAPHHGGLVLEWVYGCIVSTSEKARDGAKHPLGHILPAPEAGHAALMCALEEQQMWESKLQQAKNLLVEMLKSKMETSELSHFINAQPLSIKADEMVYDDSITDHAIIAMLRREVLLTKAKLHFLVFEHLQEERVLRTYRSQLKQVEPEFDRLKRELEEVKQDHCGLDGNYRSLAEMDHHRAQLVDQAIEEQLEVQTAFREQGAILQGIYDKKQRATYDSTKRETEVRQLQCWKGTIEKLLDNFIYFERITQLQHRGHQMGVWNGNTATASTLKTKGQGGVSESVQGILLPQQHEQLLKLRNHFHKDVLKQLYRDADERALFENLKKEVKAIEKRLDDAAVVIQHLVMHVVNATCDDPGTTLGMHLLLPALQERLDAKVKEFAAERAKMAELEILRMEEEERGRRTQAEEQRKSQKQKSAMAKWEKAQAAKMEREAQEVERRKHEEEKREKAHEQAAKVEREVAQESKRTQAAEKCKSQVAEWDKVKAVKMEMEGVCEWAAKVEREAEERRRVEEEAQRRLQEEKREKAREEAAKVDREASEAKRHVEEAQCKLQREEREKEREQEAKRERDAVEEMRRVGEEAQRKLQEEEARRKHIEARKVMLKAEVERRRQELLSGKNSHWNQHTRMEEEQAGQSGTNVAVGKTASAVDAAPTPQSQQQQQQHPCSGISSSIGAGGKHVDVQQENESSGFGEGRTSRRYLHGCADASGQEEVGGTGGEASCAAPQHNYHSESRLLHRQEDQQALLHTLHPQQQQQQQQQQLMHDAHMQLQKRQELLEQQQKHVHDARTQLQGHQQLLQQQQQHVQAAQAQLQKQQGQLEQQQRHVQGAHTQLEEQQQLLLLLLQQHMQDAHTLLREQQQLLQQQQQHKRQSNREGPARHLLL